MIHKILRLFLPILMLFPFQAACSGKPQAPVSAAGQSAAAGPSAAGQEISGPPPAGSLTYGELEPRQRAERMMKALAAGYPQAIEKTEFRNGDWAVFMKGRWFYCANGRLLPEELLDRQDSFAPQSFYRYFSDLPEWEVPEGENAERLKNALGNRRANPPRRAPDFFDTLWDAHSRNESYDNLIQIRFLGRAVLVHRGIAGRLAKIDERVQEAAKIDPAIQPWIDNIGSLGAWNWRNVAATASRSFHSYATAVDILPKSMQGLQTYWQWTADNNAEWYTVPYTRRFHPPEAIVKAFEAYGFCWGGKWPLFDTMHFEYRPEIMLMYNLPVEDIE
ncbi:MAG: M15 family metallopeptidase [Treponema sp.]|jgi:hypothetical protein|nr:M15 family metallopeptidase [Treponema sp.]